MTAVEHILKHTNNGLSVFQFYFPKADKKIFCNTYRSDTHPSCKLYYRNGRYIMHDFGSSEWCGDCFTIVALIKKLDIRSQFTDIIEAIITELNIDSSNNITSPSIAEEQIQNSNQQYNFTAICKSFKPSDLAFWNKYGITLAILRRYDVRCIHQCHLSKSATAKYTVYGSVKNPTYGYMFNNNKGIKIYRPLSTNRFLYAGELPKPYIFGLNQLPNTGNYLYITGGEKDVLSLAAHGFTAICFNSETSSLPIKTIKELYSRFNHIIIMYDSDITGIHESSIRLRELQSKQYNRTYKLTLPLAGTKREKDISDFFSLGHSAVELQALTAAVINQQDHGQSNDH